MTEYQLKHSHSSSARKILTNFLMLVIFFCLYAASNALAQQQMTPPEKFRVDENGVDVITGGMSTEHLDVSIGQSPQQGIFVKRYGPYYDIFGTGSFSTAVKFSMITCCGSNLTPNFPNVPPAGSFEMNVMGKTEWFFPCTAWTIGQPRPTCYNGASGQGGTLTATPSGYKLGSTDLYNYTYKDRDGGTVHINTFMTTNVGGQQVAFLQATDYIRADGFIYRIRRYPESEDSITTSSGYKIYTPFSWWSGSGYITAVNTLQDSCGSASACTPSSSRPHAGYSVSDYTVSDSNNNATTYYGSPHTALCGSDFDNNGNYDARSEGMIMHSGSTVASRVACYYGYERTADGGLPGEGAVKKLYNGRDSFSYDYRYTSAGFQTTVTGPNGYHKVYVSGGNFGDIYTITDEFNRVTSFAYDVYGRMTSKTDPEGNKFRYTYDQRGNITEFRQVSKTPGSPADIVVSATYPSTCSFMASCNKPTSITDARGGVANYEYDNTTGQVTRLLMPADSNGIRPETRYEYTVISDVSMLTKESTCMTVANCFGTSDELQVITAYSANLLPVTVTKKLGNGTVLETVATTYDIVGNKTYVDGPMPGTVDTTRFIYDAGRRLVGVIHPAAPDASGVVRNAAERISYTSFDQPSLTERGYTAGQDDTAWAGFTVVDKISTAYGSDERMLSVSKQNASGTALAVTQFDYDFVGRLQCQTARMNISAFGSLPSSACALGAEGTQGPDRITKNVYDAAGQLVQVRKAVGTPLEQAYATYSYTPNGKQEYVIDASGNRAKKEYDGFDRQLKWTFPSLTKPSAYDPSTQANALATAGGLNGNDYEQYGYDVNGNRTSLRKRDGQVINYSYDALNRLTLKDLPSGTDIYYGYDLRGMQSWARFGSSGGEGVSNVWDSLGRLTSSTNNIGGTSRTLTYEYDVDGNRTKLTFPDGQYFTYEYDGLDRMSAIKENGSAQIASFSYNNRGERVAIGGGFNSGFSYDGISRLADITHDMAGTGQDVTFCMGTMSGATCNPAYNPASQILNRTISNSAYVWNGHANVNRNYTANGLNQYTTAGSASFSYDPNGNLTSDGSTTYAYDVENRLLSASGATNASLAYDPMGRLWQTAGSATTRFLYDGDELVAEYDGSGNLLRRYIYGSGNDDPLVWYEGAGLSDRRHLRTDHQGSIVAISNSAGNSIGINSYDEYGIPGTGNIGRFAYTGQIRIPELGMYHYKARIYSPTLGRFLQTDPIGYNDQINLYAYVGNDPTNKMDPTGMATGALMDSNDRDNPYNQPCHGDPSCSIAYNAVAAAPSQAAGAAAGAGVSAEAALTGGALASTLLLCGDSPGGCSKREAYWFITYTKDKLVDGQTITYSGRTAGYGKTPEAVLENRDRNHHMNSLGFGKASIDRAVRSIATVNDTMTRAAIRGREQMLIDHFGGARSQGGTSGNAINGISSYNPLRPVYIGAAQAMFGNNF